MSSRPPRLVVISNRVPNPGDKKAQAGGLATALLDALGDSGGLWFGWNGKVGTDHRPDPAVSEQAGITFATMELSRRDYNEYYNGFANRTLWPLLHYRLDMAYFDRQQYSRYIEVNRLFAERLSPLLRKSDIIWVHDYHLIPIAAELRARGHEQKIGFFLHTPFPATEIMTALPNHDQLVRSMFDYDLIGFQTEKYKRAFLDYLRYEVGANVTTRHAELDGRRVRIGVFPVGIDADQFKRSGADAESLAWHRNLRRQHGDTDWLIGVDRLDYSKGLIERFRSYGRFLAKYSEFQRKVTFFQIAPPSRAEVPEYREIRHELEAEAGHINGRFADLDWVPINYINKSYTRAQLARFYHESRAGFVTPLRDGMNLVAMEYVASQNPHDPGVLILSRFAGAADYLDGALVVNPFGQDGVSDAIAMALGMPLEERRERYDSMMAAIERNDVKKWGRTFVQTLIKVRRGPAAK